MLSAFCLPQCFDGLRRLLWYIVCMDFYEKWSGNEVDIR
jgi:hypothetical protein